jgi:hypothetical protein
VVGEVVGEVGHRLLSGSCVMRWGIASMTVLTSVRMGAAMGGGVGEGMGEMGAAGEEARGGGSRRIVPPHVHSLAGLGWGTTTRRTTEPGKAGKAGGGTGEGRGVRGLVIHRGCCGPWIEMTWTITSTNSRRASPGPL